MASRDEVKAYWTSKPIFSLEVPHPPGSPEFFAEVDRLKRQDVERFGIHFWEFDRHRGERVLELGCGSGWLSANYARGGARLVATDLTHPAVELAREWLRINGLQAEVRQADAEALDFPDDHFDLVVASGVIHHTPCTEKAVAEIYRVLKPGGAALISIYYKNLLLKNWTFRLTRPLLALVRTPGRTLSARSVEDFVRTYDGDANPVGKAYSKAEARALFAAFSVEKMETHYFPARFSRFLAAGGALHRLLDRTVGTMLYCKLRKPVSRPAGRPASW